MLIIGAGAHQPYGMPVSKDLTSLIKNIYSARISGLENDPSGMHTTQAAAERTHYRKLKKEICKLIKRVEIIERPTLLGLNPNAKRISKYRTNLDWTENTDNEWDSLVISEYDSFLRSFCGSRVYSMDQYLANLTDEPNTERQELWTSFGKLTIAFLLHHFETQNLFGTSKEDWIELLINRHLLPDVSGFLENPPRIITFNYDRLLEKSIFSHLVHFHKFSYEKAVETVRSLPIIHVYGKLNEFKPPVFWDVGEFNYFLNANQQSKYHNLWKFVLYTGFRASEVGGLKWDCVHFDMQSGQYIGFVTVRRTTEQKTRKLSERTKNGFQRTIPLLPDAKDILLNMKLSAEGEFVFGGARPIETSHLSRMLANDLKKIPNIKSVTFHGLRHSFCSYVDATGLPRRIVSEIMGHKDMNITNRYSHVSSQTMSNEVSHWLTRQNQQDFFGGGLNVL